MIKILSPVVCLAAALLITGCASPSTSSDSGRPATLKELFDRADANGDGRVSRDEFIDYMVEDVFVRYDKNGNGYVTEEEYVAGGGTPEDFRKINRSGSGKITLQEAKTSKLVRDTMMPPFDEADVNQNGSVSWVEFQAFLERAAPYTR